MDSILILYFEIKYYTNPLLWFLTGSFNKVKRI